MLGAGGVVGQAAVQLARSAGAGRIVAAARGERSAQAGARAGRRRRGVRSDDTDDVAGARRAGCGGVRRPGGPGRRPAVRRARRRGRCARCARTAGWSTWAAPPAETAPIDSSTLRSRSLRVLGYTNNELTPEQRRRRADATSSARCSPGGSPSPTSASRSSTSPACGTTPATGSSSSSDPRRRLTCRSPCSRPRWSAATPSPTGSSTARSSPAASRRACARRSCGASSPRCSPRPRTTRPQLAIRAQERAGLDLLTDGEIRRESYSNHFATALDGVDVDNPGTALDRSGHPNPVPRIVGPIHRPHAGPGPRPGVPAHPHRPAGEDDRARAVHDDPAGAERPLPGPRVGRDGLRRGGQRRGQGPVRGRRGRRPDRRALPAGPPGRRPRLRARRADRRARRRRPGTTAVHLCFGYAAIIHERPSGYSFLPELAGVPGGPDLDRDRAVGARPGRAGRPVGQDDHPGRDRPVDARGRDGRGRRRAGAAGVPVPAGRAAGDRARLRDEVPPAGVRGGQDAGHGRGGRAAACRAAG